MIPAATPQGATGEHAISSLLSALLSEARHTPGLEAFGSGMLTLDLSPLGPRALPVCRLIPEAEGHRPVLDALRDAAPWLTWQQTYSRADGFSQDWLDHYGWAHLISPEGPFLSEEIRVAIAIWGAGQSYPAHAHGPEEFYLILSGRARFEAEGRPPREVGPGDTVHHAPWQSHGFAVGDQPLIAGTFWRGENLLEKSRLEPVSA